MNHPADRLPNVDVLKAVAAQLIVLHHLALYGPMSDTVHDFTPGLIEWLVNHARLAVQVFLVVGGFLAARSLAARSNAPIGNPMSLIWKRYCRLAIPFLAAIVLAIACAAIARAVLPLDSTPSAPHLLQLIAHLLLIQNLLGLDALSAGVWYVAIDFQLYALLVVLLWLSQCASATQYRPLAMTLVSALAIASLFHFNRISDWDDWALYFFGAYAMGALAFWARESRHPATWLALMAAGVIAALILDFRIRIVVALFTAVLLGLTFRTMRQLPSKLTQPLVFLGDISYSVFLVHYPVCLVVNAAFGQAFPADPVANALGMLLAWCLSLLAGVLFHRYIEKPAGIRLGSKNIPAVAPR
jgi:peptidoglycan/LPS O-acetylase OafA/YrhL